MNRAEIDTMWQRAMRESIRDGEVYSRYHFAKKVAEKAIAELESQEPLFWYRPRGGGFYEGPIHNAQIETVRQESGALWIPLHDHSPQPGQTSAERTLKSLGYTDNGGEYWKPPLGAWPPQPEQEPVAWKNAAIRLGEELSSVGPDGYYNMTAKQWLDWAMNQQPSGKNRLSQPQRTEQEPVACRHRIADARNQVVKSGYLCVDCGALFAAADHNPPKREWVGLTGETLLCAAQSSLSPEQYDHFEAMAEYEPEIYDRLAKAIRSQLKEQM